MTDLFAGELFQTDFVKDTLTPILAIIGAVFGLIGTGIGLWNLWLNRKAHREQFVIALSTITVWSQNPKQPKEKHFDEVIYTIKIVNRSYFPVTVDQVGLTIGDWWNPWKSYIPLNLELPVRVGSRDHVSLTFCVNDGTLRAHIDNGAYHRRLFADNREMFPDLSRVSQVYILTTTGHYFRGAEKELVALVQFIKKFVEAHKK